MSTDLKDIEEIFHNYDKVGDSRIGINQVGNCLRSLGFSPTMARVSALTQNYGKEARLTIEEFIPLVREVEKDTPKTTQELTDALGNLDREGNGLVNVVELRYILSAVGEKLTDEEVSILLLGMENDEGKVNIHDFVRLITS